MRVICLSEPKEVVRSGINDNAKVYIGNIYTVVNVVEYNNEDYYKLKDVEGCLFFSEMFAPIEEGPAEVIEEQELSHATA